MLFNFLFYKYRNLTGNNLSGSISLDFSKLSKLELL